MTQTTFLQKIGLFFFSLLLTLLLLEGALRLGGWFFLAAQEKLNQQNSNSSQEFRILCLGESTTALGGNSAYPRALEQILNTRQRFRQFKVINKGIPATTTDQILAKVEGYLDEYQPHLVVAMMGINDPRDLAKRGFREGLTQYSKAFKLLDMIFEHLWAKQTDAKAHFVDQQIAKLDQQAKNSPSLRPSVELAKANLYRSANRPQEEKRSILKILSSDDKNAQGWHLLGIYYQRHAEYQKALDAFENAYRFGPAEIKTASLERMAEEYKFLDQQQKAIRIYEEILKQQPGHPQAYGALADILLEEEKYDQAIKFYSQQLSSNPKAVYVYGKLAHCYRYRGNPSMGEKVFEAGAKVNADSSEFFYEWGYCLLENHKYTDAENVFNQALKLNKTDERGVNEQIYEQLLKCYEAQNKSEPALKLKVLMQAQANQYNPRTQKNYRQLAKILSKRGIMLVAVQYPHRAVFSLKQMLADLANVVFVDNQKIFTDALKKYSYDVLFSDRFAGDFGHCTPRGNALLAENVAEGILKIFQRQNKF